MYVDAPASLQSEDCFQRYEFAKRVASIASNTSNDKSLVIGLYGKWGEGKTSVLNFIKSELSPDVVTVHFNPWYFNDEQQLLKAFFNGFASVLGKEIKTGKEKIGSVLADYGASIGEMTEYIPKIGRSIRSLSNFGKKLSEITVEKQKKRVDKIIQASNKRIVVFMDDIDRLDVNEIQSVFKLVKLVGDFPNTSYILSFDDEMVSAALSPKYGGNNLIAGYNFLEKIIQIPIKLPKATKKALSAYTMNLLGKVFEDQSLYLNEEPYVRFVEVFTNLLLPFIQAPRVSLRYANTLLFSLPLLREEVDINDLMIIEGIKVVYPELYDFIRTYGYDILDIKNYDSNRYEDTNDRVKRNCEIFLNNYTDDKRMIIRNLLRALFPQLEIIYDNGGVSDKKHKEYLINKQICTKRYFERYFSYSVEQGEMSENYFNQLLISLASDRSTEETVKLLENSSNQFSAFNLVSRFRMIEEKLTEDQSKQLSLALAQIGHTFPIEQDIHFATTYAQSASLIARLFNNISSHGRIDWIADVLISTKTLEYAMEIHYWVLYREKNNRKGCILSKKDELILQNLLVERFLSEIKTAKFFDVVSDANLWRILEWWSQSKKIKGQLDFIFDNNLKEKNNFDFAIRLLKVFTPTINSTSFSPQIKGYKRKTYKSGFSESNFNALKGVVDVNLLNKNLISVFGTNPYRGELSEISDRDEIADEKLVSVFQRYIEDDNQKNKNPLV